MIVLVVTQVLASIISILSVQYQKRYNKLHKSVYGLSYDTTLLNIVRLFINVFTTLNYKFNPVVNEQLYNRFPIFYKKYSEIPISQTLVIADITLLIFHLMILKQLSLYKKTRHIHQGVSIICMSILCFTVGIIGVSTFYLSWFKIYKFLYLDHLNIMWVMGNALYMGALWPQICINWMGQCCSGVSSRYIILSIISNVVRLVGIMITNSESLPFSQWPYNAVPIFVTYMELISLLVIFYQAQFVYMGNKPRLPKQQSKLSSLI